MQILQAKQTPQLPHDKTFTPVLHLCLLQSLPSGDFGGLFRYDAARFAKLRGGRKTHEKVGMPDLRIHL